MPCPECEGSGWNAECPNLQCERCGGTGAVPHNRDRETNWEDWIDAENGIDLSGGVGKILT